MPIPGCSCKRDFSGSLGLALLQELSISLGACTCRHVSDERDSRRNDGQLTAGACAFRPESFPPLRLDVSPRTIEEKQSPHYRGHGNGQHHCSHGSSPEVDLEEYNIRRRTRTGHLEK